MTAPHGIIYAYHAAPGLGPLCARRTASSLPFCARYRLIDFTLSSMMNAGVRDVGVIMRQDYQSLLDHIGGGREWDMSRRDGGLRLLPPFGLADRGRGYRGNLEALAAVRSYIDKIKAEDIIISRGDLAASVDLSAALKLHGETDADITAVCTRGSPPFRHHRYIPGENSLAAGMTTSTGGGGEGLASLEVYIIKKERLLEFIRRRDESAILHLHSDAISGFLKAGGKMALYIHGGFGAHIPTVGSYYRASMAMLDPVKRGELFPADRPVRTKERAEAGSYYGDFSRSSRCLVADGCHIEGEAESSVIFRGVSIGRGASVSGCVLMQDVRVGAGARLSHVIADKNAVISPGSRVFGTAEEPVVIRKGRVL